MRPDRAVQKPQRSPRLGLRNYFLTLLLLLLLFIKAFGASCRSVYRICVIEEKSLSCLSYFLLFFFKIDALIIWSILNRMLLFHPLNTNDYLFSVKQDLNLAARLD